MNLMRRILLTLSMLLTACSVVAEYEGDTSQPQAFLNQSELDQLLAPIALYPDTVLSHVLIAATYPLEVVQAHRWTQVHSQYQGDEALKAVEIEDWDPSVKALVPFPDLLARMSEDLDWTQRLGEAFLYNEQWVLDSVQNLRRRAYDAGNLKSSKHLAVTRETDTIIIESPVREVVYIPYYDTRVVYGSWWWPAFPPVYWTYHNHHYHHSHFYWGPRVYVRSGFYFSAFHWDRRHVVVVDRHRHRHLHSSRHVVRHNDARRWHHNERHRRGVKYLTERTHSQFYRSAREAAVRGVNRASGEQRVQSRSSADRHRELVRDLNQSQAGNRTARSSSNASTQRERTDRARQWSNAGDQRVMSSSRSRETTPTSDSRTREAPTRDANEWRARDARDSSTRSARASTPSPAPSPSRDTARRLSEASRSAMTESVRQKLYSERTSDSRKATSQRHSTSSRSFTERATDNMRVYKSRADRSGSRNSSADRSQLRSDRR